MLASRTYGGIQDKAQGFKAILVKKMKRRFVNPFIFLMFFNLSQSAGADEKPKNYAVAPILVSNPAIGNGIGVTGMYFFDIGKSNPKGPRSLIQPLAAYTDTQSYFGGLLSSLYLRDDHIRSTFGLFGAKVNNEYRDPRPGRSDAKFAAHLGAFYAQMQFRVKAHLFLGGQFRLVNTRFSPEDEASRDYLEFVGAEDKTNAGVGPVLTYDTRDNIHSPRSGTLTAVRAFSMFKGLGSEETYHTIEGEFNRYQQLVPGHVFALRAYGRTGTSNTPYSDKSRLGMRSDLRGFKSGEIIGLTLADVQAEYRCQFRPRWGVVVFGGIAKLWDDDTREIIREDYYYSGGVGLRFMINTKERINFRVDFAIGNGDNQGFYMGIREAF